MHPLDKHSSPNEPDPEYRSNIYEFEILFLNRFECSIILNIDSLTISFNGLVFLSVGKRIFYF